MAGRGDLNEVESIRDHRIKMLRDFKWVKMSEPIHVDSKEAGIGPGASFALEYVNYFKEDIGLIPCAVGGTSITQWQEDQPLFKQMMNKICTLPQEDEIIGILWAQGETDSRLMDNALNYSELFYRVLTAINRRIPLNTIPIVLTDVPPFYYENTNYPYTGVVSEQIKKIVELSDKFGIVETNGLYPKEDGLHYNSVSYRELGRRLFHTYLKITKEGMK